VLPPRLRPSWPGTSSASPAKSTPVSSYSDKTRLTAGVFPKSECCSTIVRTLWPSVRTLWPSELDAVGAQKASTMQGKLLCRLSPRTSNVPGLQMSLVTFLRTGAPANRVFCQPDKNATLAPMRLISRPGSPTPARPPKRVQRAEARLFYVLPSLPRSTLARRPFAGRRIGPTFDQPPGRSPSPPAPKHLCGVTPSFAP
jgi:hypothetical protein